MSAVTLERRRLRSEAAERQSTAIKKLRGNVRKARAAKVTNLRKIQAGCIRAQKKLTRDAAKARTELRARIAKARGKAERVCRACKVDATDRDLDKLDHALVEVAAEREAIRLLRAKARGMKDERGRAGGRRSQELRRESDHEVEVNIADQGHREVWSQVKHQIKATPRMTRTEAFFQYLHDHPESVHEATHSQEASWLEEAIREEAKMENDWQTAREVQALDDRQLKRLTKRLDRAETYANVDPEYRDQARFEAW